MKLIDYLKSLGPNKEREKFAKKCGTSHGYLKQVAYGNRAAGGALAIAIERESKRAVKADSVCPDADWKYIRSTGKAA